MNELICPKTGEACELSGVCESRTQLAQKMVDYWSTHTKELHEQYLDSVGRNRYTLEEGKARPLTPEEIETIKQTEASAEYAADAAELDVHMTLAQTLPVPFDPEHPDAPHDSYDQLSRGVCLYGTLNAVRMILELDEAEKEQAIADLFLRASDHTEPRS
jgi:hypothetical protein